MTDNSDAKAREIAHGLIQGYVGPDHKVIHMKAFFSALVQALRDARRE
jgi:membrane-bound acyltransferase YfiQ involved in biofilm formation